MQIKDGNNPILTMYYNQRVAKNAANAALLHPDGFKVHNMEVMGYILLIWTDISDEVHI